MPDLTLDQVREAGRFAFREYGIFVPGSGFYCAGGSYDGDLTPENVYPDDRPWADGWHHLPGCDCPYCEYAW